MTCAKCKGRGFIITDIMSGNTSKCTECQVFNLSEGQEKQVSTLVPVKDAALPSILFSKNPGQHFSRSYEVIFYPSDGSPPFHITFDQHDNAISVSCTFVKYILKPYSWFLSNGKVDFIRFL